MTALTTCEVTGKARRAPAPLASLLRVVGWAAILTTLALLHVYVQFTISDLRMSARALQREQEKLDNRARELKIEVQRLKGAERIDRLARQLGMVPPKPGQVERLNIPVELASKYEGGQWRRGSSFDANPDRNDDENRILRALAQLPLLGGDSARADEGS